MAWPGSVEAWRSIVAERARGTGIPVEFLLAWIRYESAGNQCATGLPGIEAGIWQTYHPSDDRFGLTYQQNRAACDGTRLVRALSSAERAAIVDAGLAYINDRRRKAHAALDAVGADWPEGAMDFWCLVKLHHALPIYWKFLRAYLDAHGGPPSGWRVWREWVEGLSDARAAEVVGSRWAALSNRQRWFANAEKIGQYGGAELLRGFLTVELALLLGLAGVLLWLAR